MTPLPLKRLLRSVGSLLVIALLASYLPPAAFGQDATGETPFYRPSLKVIILPEKNIFEQRNRYKYITNYLARSLDIDIHIDIASSYGELCDAFINGRADAGFFGSFSYLLTHARAGVEALARPVWSNGESTYRGYIFARKDSGIRDVRDMKGKTLALVDKATTAGYIFPKFYFNNCKVPDMETYFSKIIYTGSHDASSWSVYIGETDVGAAKNHIFDELAAEYPDFAEQMLVIARSQEIPSVCLAVRPDLNPGLKTRIQFLLLHIDKSEEGKTALKKFGADKFVNTSIQDFHGLENILREMNVDLQTYNYKR